jgi:choline dehydrogenase-like flavoprotein
MTATQDTEYDAIVIGSGIAGGWAAKELTEKGLRTLMIERGRDVVHGKDYTTEHKSTWDMPLRDARLTPDKRGAEDYQMQARTGQFRESTKHFFAKDTKHPYEESEALHLDPGRSGRRQVAHLGTSGLPLERSRLRGEPAATGSPSTGRSATRTSRPGTATSSGTSA